MVGAEALEEFGILGTPGSAQAGGVVTNDLGRRPGHSSYTVCCNGFLGFLHTREAGHADWPSCWGSNASRSRTWL